MVHQILLNVIILETKISFQPVLYHNFKRHQSNDIKISLNRSMNGSFIQTSKLHLKQQQQQQF